MNYAKSCLIFNVSFNDFFLRVESVHRAFWSKDWILSEILPNRSNINSRNILTSEVVEVTTVQPFIPTLCLSVCFCASWCQLVYIDAVWNQRILKEQLGSSRADAMMKQTRPTYWWSESFSFTGRCDEGVGESCVHNIHNLLFNNAIQVSRCEMLNMLQQANTKALFLNH